MLLTVEKKIRGGICHAVHRYATANNKYMKEYNQNNESSYILYLDANNLYGWAMSQKLPLNNFEWKKRFLNSMELHSMKILQKIIMKIVL